MDNKILKEFQLEHVILRSINMNALPLHESADVNMNGKWTLSYEIEEDTLSITAMYHFSFDPATLLEADMKYHLSYKVTGEYDVKDVEKLLPRLASPCAAKNSLLIGEITNQALGGNPIVTVPFIRDAEIISHV